MARHGYARCRCRGTLPPASSPRGSWSSVSSEFLRGFYGGLLTTCGLDHIGPPTDRSADRFGYAHRSTEHLPMHGRIGAVPARLDGYGVEETEHGLEAYVAATVTQVAVFGEHLVLSRRISIAYGSTRVESLGQRHKLRLRDEPARRHVPRQSGLAGDFSRRPCHGGRRARRRRADRRRDRAAGAGQQAEASAYIRSHRTAAATARLRS